MRYPTEIETNVSAAAEWAGQAHASVNHTYFGKPYTVHLELVYGYARQFIHLLSPEEVEVALPAAWLHDVIEDCRKTYNDVKEAFGKDVAEAVYALTNEKGRNRKERANDAYYAGLRANRAAHFVKICDRRANVKYSLDNRDNAKLEMYKKETPGFKEQLGQEESFHPMFEELEKMFRD